MPKPQALGKSIAVPWWIAAFLFTLASAAACSARTDAGGYQAMFRDSFETGLDGWQTGADVPEDGERPGPVAWSIEVSAQQPSDGQSSVKFFLDGKHDDGTIWLARPFNVPVNSDLVVRLHFDAWSAAESFNTTGKVAAYAGSRKPKQEGDFDLSQALNQTAGWKRYSYSMDAQSGDNGQLWVAVGVTAVWETELTYYFDSLLLEIETRK